jgi:hypothetical protein
MTKTKAKPKPKILKGQLWGVKIRKTKTNAWMPDEIAIAIWGDHDGVLLLLEGWSTTPDKPKWPKARIQKNLGKLTRAWEEDNGKGWRLEIRDV